MDAKIAPQGVIIAREFTESSSCRASDNTAGRRRERKRDFPQGCGLQPEIDAGALQGSMAEEIPDGLYAHPSTEQPHRE